MRIPALFFLSILSTSCQTHERFVKRTFEINDKSLLDAIDSFYLIHPEYKVPDKWILYDSYSYEQKEKGNWNERRFYFPPPNEEMYSVFIFSGGGSQCALVIGAMHDYKNWHLEYNLTDLEIVRIQNRFDREILSKMEYLISAPIH